MSLRLIRRLLWLAVALVGVGLAFMLLREPPRDAPASRPLAIGGPFTLVAGDGQPYSSARLAGQPFAIFFGFTHCPDVCPTTLARLARLRRQLGDDRFAIIFVTVDPERDGPQEVGRYTALFDTPVIGLTGSAAQINHVKRQFGIFSAKVEQPGGGYSVDHSASVFLFGRDGTFAATIAPGEGDTPALAKLRRIAG